jgi:hypothetical protein
MVKAYPTKEKHGLLLSMELMPSNSLLAYTSIYT